MTLRIVSLDEDARPEGKDARIIRPLELVSHEIQSAGVARMPAITHELVGSDHLWMGITVLEPGAVIPPHHHGDRESGVYLIAGRLRLRWGPRLESTAELAVGDLAFLPPYMPHEEVNPDPDESAVWLVVWNESKAFVPLAPDADGVFVEV